MLIRPVHCAMKVQTHLQGSLVLQVQTLDCCPVKTDSYVAHLDPMG